MENPERLHKYAPVPGGVSFDAETMIDFHTSIIGPLSTRLVGPLLFSKTMANHRITHNVEETGRTQDILPTLYAAAHPATAWHVVEAEPRRGLSHRSVQRLRSSVIP
jgi:hypothetical protein